MSDASQRQIAIFDGHNDTVLSLRGTGRSFFNRTDQGHIDLPRARAGGLAGGIFAVFVPAPRQNVSAGAAADAAVASAVQLAAPQEKPSQAQRDAASQGETSVIPPPPGLTHEYALTFAMAEVARLFRTEAQSGGDVKIVRTAAELRECIENGTFAIQIHFEGAEAIDPELDALEVFHAAGLRSLGIVWSRSNAFGHGVPFGIGSPDTGPGLTEAGKELVRACNRLRIMLDLSHLNEKGFWDVAEISDAPLVCSHSNVHAISGATRNLTAKQLDAIKASNGLVGLNFHVGFLRPDGERDPNTALDVMADHVDGLVERLGIDNVGLGSDFDGATMPEAIGDVTGLPALMETLRARGYDAAALRKIGHENWVAVLERTWGG